MVRVRVRMLGLELGLVVLVGRCSVAIYGNAIKSLNPVDGTIALPAPIPS